MVIGERAKLRGRESEWSGSQGAISGQCRYKPDDEPTVQASQNSVKQS
jgi:hypothetical protein